MWLTILKSLLQGILFFAIGFIEDFITSLNSKFRQHSRKALSFVTAFINILIWYFILQSILEGGLSKIVILFYATGWALGDVEAIKFANYLEKLVKKRGFRRKIRRLFRWKKK